VVVTVVKLPRKLERLRRQICLRPPLFLRGLFAVRVVARVGFSGRRVLVLVRSMEIIKVWIAR
jgi:hypothetical protein